MIVGLFNSAITDAVGPNNLVFPSNITNNLLVTESSCFWWVIKITVFLCCFNVSIACVNALIPKSSKLEFGSSKTTNVGSPYNALANAIRCFLSAG